MAKRKNNKVKSKKLSLYPLEFDEALGAILTVKPDSTKSKKKEKQ
jgi:hypothetical protein